MALPMSRFGRAVACAEICRLDPTTMLAPRNPLHGLGRIRRAVMNITNLLRHRDFACRGFGTLRDRRRLALEPDRGDNHVMRFQTARCVALFLAAGIVAPALAAQQTTSPPKTAIAPDTSRRYLRPGDHVVLKVSREPDLSGDFTIDDRGVAVLPRLGEVHVTDMTPDSVRRFVINSYSKYLVDPSIDVVMTRRIAVLGAVKNPGMFQADPTVTVADVIALAGGVTPDGRVDRIELLRDGKEIVTR